MVLKIEMVVKIIVMKGSTSSVDGINVEDEAVPQANIDAQSQESSSSQVYYLVAGLLAFLIVIVIILKKKKT